jgi:hypothetical protein
VFGEIRESSLRANGRDGPVFRPEEQFRRVTQVLADDLRPSAVFDHLCQRRVDQRDVGRVSLGDPYAVFLAMGGEPAADQPYPAAVSRIVREAG